MLLGLCALCFAAFTRFAETVGPVVRCEPCDPGTLVQCKPLPHDCAEGVREPGCGCCLTCALAEGHACGVYTGRCGTGLTCQPRPGESLPLQALLEGRGACSGAAAKRLGTILLNVQKQENPREEPARAEEPERRGNITSATSASTAAKAGGAGADAMVKHRGTIEAKLPQHTRLDVIKKEQSKKTQSYKVESVSGGLNTDTHNFSLENKRENEYGPCRREIESTLNSLKISNVLNPRGFRIPNCDKKGFYKKKQCRPSKGRKRGYCWCVDKYGQPLPGINVKGNGEVLCYHLESK
ncbi:hypothetical protein DPEC_G00339020 [Dallia pectoralis]|uniref:Uncharacterized protein n=1 Tax=Dallia pectoralis TaxID=75939 RepID=A0ACC2F4T1_DALPE|nr:hypothetical protein DPEC_G00339020 [Dallia pectoralis]